MPAAILRSYQVFGADDQVLTAAVEAVKKACKDAKSQSKVQRVALHRRGYRQDIEVGDVFVVPTSVCNDPEDFPTILLSANLQKHATGEGMVEFQMGALVEPGELSRDSLQEFKKVVFTDAKGDAAPLVVFAPAWAHPSAYQSFVYEEDNLLDRLREVAYASPFNPSLSAVFDQLRACDPDAAPAARIMPITQHIYKITPSEEKDYPEFAKGLDIADEEGGRKKASMERRPVIRLRAAEIPELEKASLTDEEMAAFDAVQDQVQKAVKKGGDYRETGGQPEGYTEPEFGDNRQPGVNLELGERGNVSDRTPDLVDGPDPKTAADEDNNKTQVNVTIPPQAFAGGGSEAGAAAGSVAEGVAGVGEALEAVAPLALAAGGHYAYKVDGGMLCSGCASKKGITKGGVAQSHMDVQNKSCKDCGKTLGHAAKGFKDVKEVTAGQIVEEGLEPSIPETSDNKAPEGAENVTVMPVKRASMALDTVAACRKFIEYWGGQTIDGTTLKKELSKLTDKLRDAVVFMKDEGSLVPEGKDHYKVMGADLQAQAANPPKLSFVLRNAKTKQVWVAASVDGLYFGGEWSDDRADATRFASKVAAQDEIRRHMLASEASIVAKTCECGGDCKCCQNKKTAGGWWNPGSVIENFYPELQHDSVDSPFISQVEGPVINPFGAPGKEAPADPNAMGLSQGLDLNEGGTPLRQENSFYGPEYARNFYAPHTSIPGNALSIKKKPLGNPRAASAKKADVSLSLFQGLELAPEEHPQAHFDEAAPTPEQGAYNEPIKEDAVPQDETFKSMDQFLKGVVAAYAAQLIAAFQVTNKPITMGTPYKDKLDLHQTLEVGGGPNMTQAQTESAKAQFDQAMSNLSDDQKQMLVQQAFAQAAVWCNNAEGSGGFNYEVFVRAHALNGPNLEVVVVTGAK